MWGSQYFRTTGPLVSKHLAYNVYQNKRTVCVTLPFALASRELYLQCLECKRHPLVPLLGPLADRLPFLGCLETRNQVVVLSEGRVVEAGHPHLLLQSPGTNTPKVDGKPGADAPPPNATLASMVDETGPANADNLRRLARHAWEGLQRDRNGDSGQG